MSYLGLLLLAPLDTLRLLLGLAQYRATGATPPYAYQSMIRLHTLTGGWSNDLLAAATTWLAPAHPLPPARGLLEAEDPQRVAHALRENGCVLFPEVLPAATCDRLLRFALTQAALPRAPDVTAPSVYARGAPLALRYDFEMQDVINNAEVQSLLADESILAVARAYLGTTPVADVTALWWHTARSGGPREEEDAAQRFHYDMDRVKWLKFFFYLTDVTGENGPHCFVEGSHRAGAVPWALRRRGYARLTDEEVRGCFAASRIRAFTAPRGTLIIEDSRGLHKGLPVRSGDRLMLQLQFSCSLFGGAYPPVRFAGALQPALAQRLREMPGVYRAYAPQA